MKRTILSAVVLIMASSAIAQQKTEIKTFNLAGPYAVSAPMAMDTVDLNGKKFDDKSLLGSVALTSRATARELVCGTRCESH